MIMSCYGLGTIFGGSIGGKLSDQISPRIVSIGNLLLQSLGFFILMVAKSPCLLMLALLIIGFGSYGFIISNHTWTLSHSQQKHRLKTINILDASSNLGLGISGIIISLVSTESFHILFLIAGTILLALTANLILKYDKTTSATSSDTITDELHTAQNHIFYFVLFSVFIAGLIISQISSTYPIYLQHLFPSMGNKSFGILFTINTFFVVFLQTPIVNLIGKLNKTLLSSTGVLLLGTGLLILNFSYIFAIAILACIVTTIGEILFFSVAQLICYESGSDNKKGSRLGLFRTFYAASRIAGPVTGGFIYQIYSGQTLWLCCFICGMVCFIVSLVMINKGDYFRIQPN
jgi:MFS family permease